MPFDPSLPEEDSDLESAVMRAQLNALNDKIDAVPAGAPGAAGQGFVFRGAWDGTASYAPYDVATHAGAVFLAVTVVSPTPTEPPDDVRWVLFAQRGTDGGEGIQGIQGEPGEVTNAALASAIAETLATAAASSSANSNAVPTLDTSFADPDTEALRQAFNALALALRR